MTRSQLRENIRKNLSDSGVTFYQDEEINQSIQSAYNDLVSKTQCIVKEVTLDFLAEVNYYDFLSGNSDPDRAVNDFLGTIAIFNNNTNLWLRDDVNLRDLDRIRIDWELWRGQTQFWVPKSLKYTVFAPVLTAASGNFKLFYCATAPILTDEDDVVTEFQVAADVQNIMEWFSTGDLLASADEPSKAIKWLQPYLEKREAYKARCQNLATIDLLSRI